MNRKDAKNAEHRKEGRGDRGTRTSGSDLGVLSAFLGVLCASAVDPPIRIAQSVVFG